MQKHATAAVLRASGVSILLVACQVGTPLEHQIAARGGLTLHVESPTIATFDGMAAVSAEAPSCVPRGCVGACGAQCSPNTCTCEIAEPATFVSCEGTTGVYRTISAYRCYTSQCCQFHDNCLGDEPATCVSPSCLACHAAAVALGCALCAGNGFDYCSDGPGGYQWFDENVTFSFVGNDPRCCVDASCDARCQDPGQGGQPWLRGSCNGPSCGSCLCDPGRCDSYCAQRGTGSVGTCVNTGNGSGCSCSLPPSCVVACDTNCGQPANVPPGCPPTSCPNTDTCTDATCGQIVCGRQCPPCGCQGTVNACGECNGPTGGCDGCGNVWYDACGVMCGESSSCGCEGVVNACGECNGPTGGCDGCGSFWYDACGEPCGDDSDCGPPGGGFCPDYGAGFCFDDSGEAISARRDIAASSTVQRAPDGRHRRSPEERAARAADAARLLEAWRLEATHKLTMTPAEHVQLGKILERQITALRQPGVRAGGGRRQAQLQANTDVAKLLGAKRFARYEAVRRAWMTGNQGSRGFVGR